MQISILYKLKYGEIGTTVGCNSNPIAQFNGKLRLLRRLAGYEFTSMGVFDINKHKLDKWNAGVNMVAACRKPFRASTIVTHST